MEILGLYLIGLVLGWAREESGSLAVPLCAHVLYNCLQIALSRIL